MELKERFYKVYYNLPLNLRSGEIILAIREEPITWKIAELEIRQNTALSKEILEKLSELGII